MNYRISDAGGTIQESNISQGALIGADLGSGVEVVPTLSTTTAPTLRSAGDEASKGLIIGTKGTGTLTLGSSANQPVVITSTAMTLGTSTSGVRGIDRYLIQYTPASLPASTSVQSTITVLNLSTTSVLFFTPLTPGLSMAYAYRVQCSTAAELRFTEQNITGSTIGTGESTSRGMLLELKF